jgi:hypothetical protein
MEMPVAQVQDQTEAMESLAAVVELEALAEPVQLLQELVEPPVMEQAISLLGV